jgi:hypothetical protein
MPDQITRSGDHGGDKRVGLNMSPVEAVAEAIASTRASPRNRGDLESTLVVAYEVDSNALDDITLSQTVRDAVLVVESRI